MDLSELLLLLAEHWILTALPGVAAALFVARRGVRQVPVLLAILLAASGLAGLLGFWAFYGDKVIGETFAYFVLFGSLGLAGWSLYGGHLERALLRRLAIPLGLWALGSAFIVFLGFVHGGTAEPLVVATTRFSHPLPGDNFLPLYFAEYFFQHGHRGTPPDYASFLSSDRPPLQIGYTLAQRPFGWDKTGMHYQVLGVVLQQMWIVGLWALLLAARVGRVTRALATIAVLVSGLAIVNGFFVWPKLLPAAMLLAAAALVMTPLWRQLRRNLWAAALVAILCALAMLGHGSSAFGIVPLAAVAAYRGLPSWRWLGVAAAVGIVLMGSWSAYQKYADPPGDRLTKWTLAGVVDIDHRGATEAILDAYGEAGLGGTLHNKAENFATMSGGTMTTIAIETAVENGDLSEIARTLRVVSFFYLLPAIGLMLLAPFVMAAGRLRRRRESREWSFALTSFVVFGVGAVFWGLVVFGNGVDRTLLHICSYLLPILGIVGAIAGLRAVLPRFALGYVSVASALSLALYAPSLDPPAGTSYSAVGVIAAALALAGFVAVALLSERDRAEPQAATADAPPSAGTRTTAGSPA
jgi:hypothetical protein